MKAYECKNQALGVKWNRGRAPQPVLAFMRQPRGSIMRQGLSDNKEENDASSNIDRLNLHETSEVTFVNNTILPRYYEPTKTDYLPAPTTIDNTTFTKMSSSNSFMD